MKITPDALPGLKQALDALSQVKSGTKLNAEVVGPTRHGLAIRIGSETLLLNTKAELPQVGRLTLEVTAAKQGVQQGVQVTTADDLLLQPPVQGNLSQRTSAARPDPAPSIQIKNQQIEVQARPIAGDGKALGPPVTVRLAVGAAPPAQQPMLTGQPVSSQQDIAVDRKASSTVKAAASAPTPPSGQDPNIAQRLKVTGDPQTPAVILSDSTRTASAAAKGNAGTNLLTLQQQPNPSEGSGAAPNSQASPSPANRGAPQVITATVIAHPAHAKQVVLQTQNNTLMKVESPIDLPVGTSMQMVATSASMHGIAPARSIQAADQADPLTKLIELLSLSSDSEPDAASPEGQKKSLQLPLPDRQLAARLLNLIVLQMGAPPDEPGMAGSNQHRATGSTTQLQSLLSDISNGANDQLTDGWRSMTLPLGHDQAQAIMIAYRDLDLDPDSEPNNPDQEESPAKRALFEVNFSRLGRCQLDVLCQEQRFDLFVRSERPLDTEACQAITDLFRAASEIAGFKGEIGFQNGQFVEPAKSRISTNDVTT